MTKEKVIKAMVRGGNNIKESTEEVEKFYDDVIRIYKGQGLTPKRCGEIVKCYAISDI